MTDHWKSIRDNIKGLHEIDAEGVRFFNVTEVESLLADADALLEVKKVCDDIMAEAPKQDADDVPIWLDRLLGKLSLTLALLPSQLQKGE